jgi:hypothetical protein
MPNSAISFNTSGLATTTSPGLVGTGAQTFAGKKTLDGGALIKGDTSGVVVPAGYVGEVLQSNVNSLINVTHATGLESNITTLVLTAGVYEVSGMARITRNGATVTNPEYVIGVVANGQTNSTVVEGGLAMQYPPTTFSDIRITTASIRVICTGTNIIIYATGTGVSYATTSMALRAYTGSWSAGTPQYCGVLRAVRIA